MTGRGVLPLLKVPQKVKISARYYVNCVLKPLLEVHLRKLYGKKINKVVVHHDAASSHTAKLTQDYTKDLHAKLGIKIISNSEIPVKSPDVSPMDFFGFGYLKRKMFTRRPKILEGVWKTSTPKTGVEESRRPHGQESVQKLEQKMSTCSSGEGLSHRKCHAVTLQTVPELLKVKVGDQVSKSSSVVCYNSASFITCG